MKNILKIIKVNVKKIYLKFRYKDLNFLKSIFQYLEPSFGNSRYESLDISPLIDDLNVTENKLLEFVKKAIKDGYIDVVIWDNINKPIVCSDFKSIGDAFFCIKKTEFTIKYMLTAEGFLLLKNL